VFVFYLSDFIFKFKLYASLACNHALLYRQTALSTTVNRCLIGDNVADGATFFSLALRRCCRTDCLSLKMHAQSHLFFSNNLFSDLQGQLCLLTITLLCCSRIKLLVYYFKILKIVEGNLNCFRYAKMDNNGQWTCIRLSSNHVYIRGST